MEHFFGCDAHKKYSVFVAMNEAGVAGFPVRVEHDRVLFRSFLQGLPDSSSIAVETVGNWYWMVEEMEKAGHISILAHAGKAKLMMGQINKTDKLDARGLALLMRNGTLPSVWIPPGELRDQRELPRMRMVLRKMRTTLKNRIHATFAKYAIQFPEVSDLFGIQGRQRIAERLGELPPQTRRSVEVQLEVLDGVEEQMGGTEEQMRKIIEETPAMRLVMTLPGVGQILTIVIVMEIGEIERFADAAHLASYAGTVPRVQASGGRTFYGKVRPDVNRYLKWALVEAANVIVVNQQRMAGRHVVQLYRRIQKRKGHAKAVVAVARHLAEATYWVLKKQEPYREPAGSKIVSSTQK
jgi:transposase